MIISKYLLLKSILNLKYFIKINFLKVHNLFLIFCLLAKTEKISVEMKYLVALKRAD